MCHNIQLKPETLSPNRILLDRGCAIWLFLHRTKMAMEYSHDHFSWHAIDTLNKYPHN